MDLPATLSPLTHDGLAAQECTIPVDEALGGQLRLVLLAPNPVLAAPVLLRAMKIAAELARWRDDALHYLWQAEKQPQDADQAPEGFLHGFTPSDLVVASDGSYTLHLHPLDARWFADGYWPCVQFSAAGQPTGWVCEA